MDRGEKHWKDRRKKTPNILPMSSDSWKKNESKMLEKGREQGDHAVKKEACERYRSQLQVAQGLYLRKGGLGLVDHSSKKTKKEKILESVRMLSGRGGLITEDELDTVEAPKTKGQVVV